MTNAVQGILIEAQRQPAQHEVAGGKVESAAEVLPTDSVTAPALWPRDPEVRPGVTATPSGRSPTGTRTQEGYCMVAVPKGALAFQCSYRIDPRGRSRNPLCREHQAEYSRRTL